MAGHQARSAVFAYNVPAIHVICLAAKRGVDARHKAGHDG
jgi:hypothetical protein